MKKFFTIFALGCLLTSYCKAQFVTIPDVRFKNLLIGKYPGCFNGSGQMDTTCTAITTEDSLEFHGLGWESSRLDMTGIQYFDNLKYLDFSANCIDPYSLGASSLDPGLAYLVLPASLLVVKCRNLVSYGIGITSGERFLLPNGLEYLDYSGCRSKVRLNSPPSLKYLDCSGNSLTDIGVLPATLDTLICYDQERYEGINFYSLGGIPALPAGLRYLDCHSNSVSNLPPLPNSLTWLDCSGMVYHSSEGINVPRLDSLPALPSSLQYLNCGGNRLTKLPVLPASLTYLDAGFNKFVVTTTTIPYNFPGISVIPNLPASLATCKLVSNDISCLPPLPASLQLLNIFNNPINCLYNSVAGLVTDVSLPICDAGNNTNNCPINNNPYLLAAPPTISVAGFPGVPSASSTFVLSGANLSPAAGNISVTATASLEISLDNISFSALPLSIGYTGGLLPSTNIYVRIPATAGSGIFTGSVTNSGGTASDAVVTVNGAVARNYYNTKANLGLTNPGTWSTTEDGSGPSPVSLTAGNQVFNIINSQNANYTGVLDVGGINSKLVIGKTGTSIVFDIHAGADSVTSATILDVANGSLVNLYNTRIPRFGTLANNSTVYFGQAGTGISDTIRIPAISYHSLFIANGLKYLSAGTTTVRGNFTANGITSFNGAKTGGLSVLNCLRDVTITSTTFEPDATGSEGRFVLKMNGTVAVQTIRGNNNEIVLLSLERDNTSASTTVISSNVQRIKLGNSNGGGLFMRPANSILQTDDVQIVIRGAGAIGTDNALGTLQCTNTSFSFEKDAIGTYPVTTNSTGRLKFTPGSTIRNLRMFILPVGAPYDHIDLENSVTLTGSLNMSWGKIIVAPGEALTTTTNTGNPVGSKNSFVDGTLVRTSATSINFPVGNGDKYAPVTVQNLAGSATYSVTFTKAGYGNYAIDPATQSGFTDYRVSQVEYWNILPSAAGNASMLFEYKDAGSMVNMDPLQLRAAHFDGSDWNDLGIPTLGANTGTNGSVLVNNVTASGIFSFASGTVVVVPVTLVDFSVKKQGKNALLFWTTEQELNSKEFIVQRSLDGRIWADVTSVLAAGNSSNRRSYTAIDQNPSKGMNYYRLKQVDLDDQFKYSDVKTAFFSNEASVILFPNPASEQVTIYMPGNTSLATIRITDMHGKLVKEVYTTDETVKVNVGVLAKGVYVVKMNGKGVKEVRKLVVN